MEHPNIDKVILAFLQKKATTNEIEELRKWINDSKDHKAVFDSIRHYWEASKLQVKSDDIESAYSKLNISTKKEHVKDDIIIHKINSARTYTWYKVAAVFFAIVVFSGLAYVVKNREIKVESVALVHEMIKENPKGQKLTTYLPDGSKVILNSQSKIKYKNSNSDSERLVELEGEAFFEVKKDSLRPFVVLANGVSTTALGTSFNVNSKHRRTEVALISGKVKVEKGSNQSVILAPGKSAVMDFDGIFKVSDFDYLDKAGWKDGVLVFNDNSLSEIIAKLEDWYGVKFISSGELEHNFHYSGNYKNETLEDVLYGISFVHNFEFEISGDTVEIIADTKNQMPM